ncbi:indolepyruvate ferredoxin oxidoreductase family protein [Bradyrhizobium commune]|uniref:Indolepyruvate ferredoxin oxidoreductase family protein n=1 Tax=Bradyrhizobium commune TaxID=83627 RepID=A0A7S9D3V7_9BRAD|nr:indolepyruvate ferredoxin oxidoreductase family protein [Bradyrhizobium commune]QPF90672.1 indolepyruvate ferredoxin oxidoreductase family protein [Bradyrhizobium commune]
MDPAQQGARPSLDDRYAVEDGQLFLTGNQALVRMLVEQMRGDHAAGLRSRAFVTGYPGSPLGSIDMALQQAKKQLDAHGITHLPAQNEESAASSLMGTQMLDEHPHPDVDGVVGYWYGKGPGLDRAGDALKHGNFAGTSQHGAVVLLSGEDHEAKSSTVPYQQEFAFEHHGIPVLYPADIQEFLDMGLHAAAMSRFSGCWVALKLVGALCDGGEVVRVHGTGVPIVIPDLQVSGKPFAKVANHRFFPVVNVETERKLYEERHVAVQAYGRANTLNKIMAQAPTDRIGILSAGKSWSDTLQALEDLGFGGDLSSSGIRLGKIGLLCPLDRDFIQEFARGLTTIIVVEEKRDFLERQVAAAAIGSGVTRVLGKRDESGDILFPVQGGLNSDMIADGLARVLSTARKATAASAAPAPTATAAALQIKRTPNYCSGCPHNASTLLAPGQVAWGAPGCHLFAALMDKPQKRVEATTQLGGEGLPWIGLAPYTSRHHIVQNLGDGALFHSSYQNIRYAATTGVNITFKILLNGVLANTGGQEAVSVTTVSDLLSHLSLEKISKIVLITKEPERYRGVTFPSGVTRRPLDDLESTMAELAAIPGVTIVIYDGMCANERRRRQKRGLLPPPSRFTFVNEDVCENCGDCGVKANCMSLQKVETEFGLKTQIHQSSCNQDQACVAGDCPSFVTVDAPSGAALRKPSSSEIDASMLVDLPPAQLEKPFNVYIPGLGGTGVLTASAILAQAAALDGLNVKTYDQTGAAQKWGPVLSSLVLSPRGIAPPTNTVGRGKADLYLALDLLAAVEPANLARCNSNRTRAVMNTSVLPNGEMIRDVRVQVSAERLCETIGSATNGTAAVAIDARRIAESLFGDYLMTNMVAIGAAHQAGWLPISAASIEAAIALNGTQAKANIHAFRAGRLSQSNPDTLVRMVRPRAPLLSNRLEQQERRSGPKAVKMWKDVLAANSWMDSTTRDLIEKRFMDLVDYQDLDYARKYLHEILRIAEAERAGMGEAFDATIVRIAARSLHRLMAYKDEYEVARLLTQSSFEDRLRAMFTGPVRISYNLQPPLARQIGVRRKVRFGTWFKPAMTVLARLKFLRGTPFDPFGRLAVRREERELIRWYMDLIDQAVSLLHGQDLSTVAAILALPEEIRGYEQIKSTAAARAEVRARELLGSVRPDIPSEAKTAALVAAR